MNNNSNSNEYDENKENFYLIMELYDDNLYYLLNKKKEFNDEEIFNIINLLNISFKVLKDKEINQVIHVNIKLQNIFVKYIIEQKTKFKIKLFESNSKISYFLNEKMKIIDYLDYYKFEVNNEEKENKHFWILMIMLLINLDGFTFNKNNNNKNLDELISKLPEPFAKDKSFFKQYFGNLELDININNILDK